MSDQCRRSFDGRWRKNRSFNQEKGQEKRTESRNLKIKHVSNEIIKQGVSHDIGVKSELLSFIA